MLKASEVRQKFLEFFEREQHQVVASGPLVPDNDPTLMFTNAGMVPFKDVFTGRETRPYQRACSSQKCIRISGKHNDLENVGVTSRHHTFFEMLGNFSFGDYFKEAAIAYAWQFVTKELCLDKSRLMVSIFAGDAQAPADDDAALLWKKIAGLPDARIARCDAKENFWQMGDTGPCGPCSEIHIYLGEGEADPGIFGQEPDSSGRGWVELWNLVFMQFERSAGGILNPLPKPSIDTGAGLERLTAICQGLRSNYDTELLQPIICVAAELSNKTYRHSQSADDISMRVIADHARTAAMLIAEGVFPDRDGRPYVLRRVMRRAIRHGQRLGLNDTFFYKCVLEVENALGDAYPELSERRALIEQISRQEEERFRRTMHRGLELLANFDDWTDVNDGHGAEGGRLLPGAFAFLLYDTYGFPLDLQEVIGAEQGFSVDQAGFEHALEQARARSSNSKVGQAAVSDVHHQVREALQEPVSFSGYDTHTCRSQIVALLHQAKQTEQLNEGSEGELVLTETPFYSEAGGQVGDLGLICTESGEFEVFDTQRPLDGLVLHHGRVRKGTLSTRASAVATVDETRREGIRRHHSATHLLHYALRTELGPHAVQKGSRVEAERLRFDYSHAEPLTADQVQRIEERVLEKIVANAPIQTEVMSYAEAKRRGAMGLFEEKYGDVVRMLTMTDDSIELCGGLHARRTGDLGYFRVLSDSGVAAGIRRIEAVTGRAAYAHARASFNALADACSALKTSPDRLVDRVNRLVEDHRGLTKKLEASQRKLAEEAVDPATQGRKVDGVFLLGSTVEGAEPKALRELAEQLRDRHSPAVILLGAALSSGKVSLACAVSKEVTGSFHAGEIIKQAAALVGGGGGGRPDFAQAGGSNAAALPQAVQTVYAGSNRASP